MFTSGKITNARVNTADRSISKCLVKLKVLLVMTPVSLQPVNITNRKGAGSHCGLYDLAG